MRVNQPEVSDMSERFASINAGRVENRAEMHRKAAVIAALELIAAAVSNPANEAVLSQEISRVSEYADLIQKALDQQ